MPDDTFSQKTAIWVHIYKLLKHEQNFEANVSAINVEDNEDENYTKMKSSVKAEFVRAR